MLGKRVKGALLSFLKYMEGSGTPPPPVEKYMRMVVYNHWPGLKRWTGMVEWNGAITNLAKNEVQWSQI